MTLVVASVEDSHVWMVTDAAVTGGPIGHRDRKYEVKAEPLHGTALAAFAGDSYHGRRALHEARSKCGKDDTLAYLTEVTRNVPSVEFACGFNSSEGPSLFRIANNKATCVGALHLGVFSAFSHFQRVRHKLMRDHAPSAIHQLLLGVAGEDLVPEGVVLATRAMWQLFAIRQERDVGGWALPYILYSSGAKLCSYGYSVTDPIAERLSPGTIIPHGSAEGGGFAFSLTPLRDGSGFVVYWLQSHKGMVLRRKHDGYEPLEIAGTPSEFKRLAEAAIKQEIDLWFKEPSEAPASSIATLKDELGRPRIDVLRHDNSLAFAWVQSSEESFSTSATIPFLDKKQ